jgi:hypothetical protein
VQKKRLYGGTRFSQTPFVLKTWEAKSFNPVRDRPGKRNSHIQPLLGFILDNHPHKEPLLNEIHPIAK